MNALRNGGGLAALLAAALPALFLGCGSSSSSPAPKPVPTVALTGTTGSTVNGPVTVTFTFSQPMSAFPASDVTVTGGTAAASTALVDSTHYTLVVTPPANATGTETISVAAGAFTDADGTASAAAASASQAYDTVTPTVTIGGTSATTATGPTTFTFTFSRPVSAFPVSDVTVTGGTAAAATVMTDSTHYSLVVTPLANSNGTEHVSVAAGAFQDAAGNLSTAAASASQNYDTVTPPVAPTVAITGNSATTATGPTTFTFTFSQPMNAFPVADVTVTGGTPAASTTLVDSTHYTLVVTPPANSTGTEQVTVSAGAFVDAAGLGNLASASASQAFDTTVVTVVSYPVIDFNTPLTGGEAYLASDFNGEISTLTSTGVPAGAPAGSGPVFLETTVVPGTTVTSGTTLSVGGSLTVGSVPFYAAGATTPTHTTMTMVVYAPAAGLPIELKVENTANNGQSVETHANTTGIGWQTLTFDFSMNVMPNGLPTGALNSTFTYDKISVFPAFLTSPAANLVFWVGPITFIGASAPLAPPLPVVAPPAGPTAGAPAPAPAATLVIPIFNSSNKYTDITIGNLNPNWGQASSIAPATAGSANILLMTLSDYQGIDISGPNGAPTDTVPAPISIAGKTTFHISYWTSDGVSFQFSPIDAGDHENHMPSGTLVQNAWTDLEFSCVYSGFDPTTLRQLLFVAGPSTGHIYLDNMYFH